MVRWTLPISIHALLAESDIRTYQRYFAADISIHALLAESDSAGCNCRNVRPDFYPRSPCGERPTTYGMVTNNQTLISIHALLAESDCLIHSKHS